MHVPDRGCMRAVGCPLCARRLLLRLAERQAVRCGHSVAAGSKTHYEVLGVPRDATLKDIKNAFYTLSKKYHPDVTGQPSDSALTANFVRIKDAYEVLRDADRRKEYDRLLLADPKGPIFQYYERPDRRPFPGARVFNEHDYAKIFEFFRDEYGSRAHQERVQQMRRRAQEHEARLREEYAWRRKAREEKYANGNSSEFPDWRERRREASLKLLNTILGMYLFVFLAVAFLRVLLLSTSGDWRMASERRRSVPQAWTPSASTVEHIDRMVAQQPLPAAKD